MSDIKAQFGSGGNLLEGWRNHEIGDADIRKPLPYADGSVDMAMASHVIEHVTGPECFNFLVECHRILKPAGQFWLSVPVLDRLPPYHARDIVLGHGHLIFFTAHSVETLLRLAGFHQFQTHADGSLFGHERVIGKEKDDLESARYVCIK